MPPPPIPTVPIPGTPSNPSGGSGNAETYYGLKLYSSGDAPAAADFDNLVNLLGNGVSSALAAVGAGTIIGGDSAGTSGLTLTLNAWRGNLPQSSERVGYAPGFSEAAALAIPASSSFVVWAVPVAGTYPDAAATPYDTAESGIASLEVVTDGTEPDGGTPLSVRHVVGNRPFRADGSAADGRHSLSRGGAGDADRQRSGGSRTSGSGHRRGLLWPHAPGSGGDPADGPGSRGLGRTVADCRFLGYAYPVHYR